MGIVVGETDRSPTPNPNPGCVTSVLKVLGFKMIIRMERSGGFAGMTLRAEIDSEQLDEHERLALQELVTAADFFNLPDRIEAPNVGADRFVYVFSIEQSGDSHTVEVNEGGMPEQLQPLVNRVTLLARRYPKH